MKVAIVGYGTEGAASYRYYSQLGADITIVDESEEPKQELPAGVKVQLGPDALDDLNGFDLVLRTPPIHPARLHTDGKVWSATREFFDKCPAPIIGITGTKGKGTTSSFIAEILKAAGETVHLVGNIGVPALDVLPQIKSKDIVVFELSSFQLWDSTDSPHVSVVLMIEPDHLDVHDSMADYINAKANIVRWQKPTDTAIYNPSNAISKRIANYSSGTKLPYTEAPAAYVKNGSFYINEQKICSTSTVVIPGTHNLDNACAAITAAWQFTHDPAAVEAGLHTFTGLPHRLKLVRKVDEVAYYDDSIATTPGSAIAAIAAFDEPKVLILGGSDKGAEYGELIAAIRNNLSSIRGIITIGETGRRIAELLKNVKVQNGIDLGTSTTMQEIVEKAKDLARPGDVVILSPASASFGMFKNYADRGEQFVIAVERL